MNKTLKWILLGIGLIAVFIVVAKVTGNKDGDATKVTAEEAKRRTIIETVSVSGKVYPEVEVKISPDISGEIVELNVQEGDSVLKGQVLARIYADIYSSQRDEAAARVSQAQATVANSQAAMDALKAQLDQDRSAYERNKALYEQKVISKAEFEQFDTKYKASQSQYNAAIQNIRSLQASTQSTRTNLDVANKNLSRTTLTAPMDGVISSLSVKKGERVAGNSFNVGTEIMRVANMSSMEVRVDVGENDIVKVNVGDSADITVEAYNARKFKGVVTQIASSTKSTTTTISGSSSDVTNYEVRIRIDASSYSDLVDPAHPRKFVFRPGMNASADIKTRRKDNVVSVPSIAVVSRVKGSEENIDQKKKEKKQPADDATKDADNVRSDELEAVVFVVNKDNTVTRRPVKTGIQDIIYFEIVSGLNEGEKVVTAPYNELSKTLKTGTKIKIVSKDELFEKK